jgi:hypothetical protein
VANRRAVASALAIGCGARSKAERAPARSSSGRRSSCCARAGYRFPIGCSAPPGRASTPGGAAPLGTRPRRRWLTERIRAIQKRSRATYGSPCVHAELRGERVRVGRKRVERCTRSSASRRLLLCGLPAWSPSLCRSMLPTLAYPAGRKGSLGRRGVGEPLLVRKSERLPGVSARQASRGCAECASRPSWG